MLAGVIASSQSSSPGSSPWILLEEFATIAHRRNATTATALTSAGGTVEISFELVDPPAISPWFANFSGVKEREYKRKPQILNATDSLILMRMAVFPDDDDGRRAVDYFVYNAGGGSGHAGTTKPPWLVLIPGPYPKTYNPKQFGILPCGGVTDADEPSPEHYHVIFPARRVKAQAAHEMHVFSSATQAWTTKLAMVAVDWETGLHDVVRHAASSAVPAGGRWMAWIDLWRGVLLCNVLDEDPVLRMLQWPVPPPRGEFIIEMYDARSIRDATVSAAAGEVRFVEVSFDGGAGTWTATAWKREFGSAYWFKCFEVDIADILAKDSTRLSSLVSKVWDDEVEKRGLSKVCRVAPTLSLSAEDDVVYLMTGMRSEGGASPEAMLLAVDGREARLEAVEEVPFFMTYTPCAFPRLDDRASCGTQQEH
ncbi:unnamed protein product [Urochloa decumbens]|uniref:DUF1618 domain-containing protein n=1 Tax=Urochloa decumbens TaxID=240449 RepID=A0ABC9ED62_9POAL